MIPLSNPNPDDEDISSLFGDFDHIVVPDDHSIPVDELDCFADGGSVDISQVEIELPPESASEASTIAPENVGTEPASIPSNLPSLVGKIPIQLVDHPRYRILRLIGCGGMGSVYEAEHRVMHRRVALKLIHQHFTANPAAAERFRREVRTAARLHHNNIVQAYDAEEAGGLHFLVMEYVEGGSLSDYLKQHGPLPFAEACSYIWQAAEGLQYANEHKMIHRDIKPDNLMRTTKGTIKILDFGLARFAQCTSTDEPLQQTSNESSLTQVGTIMGTPDYMAPEQGVDSHQVDIRADIYSLGCTLYQLLTGQVPYPGGTVADKIIRHGCDSPTPICKLRKGVPHELMLIVEKMMAKKPAARYQSPAEVVEVLRPFEHFKGGQHKRTLMMMAIAGVAVVGVVALIRWIVF